MITPIETEYKGYHFRSRLEARWAVFFDACGVEWEYELQGFDLGDGMRYLPDFVLHGVRGRADGDVHVEVKGRMGERDARKIRAFCGFDETGVPSRPLLLLADVPFGETIDQVDRRIRQVAYGRGSSSEAWPYPFNCELLDGTFMPAHPCVDDDGRFAILGDIDSELGVRDVHATMRAYRAARQARFEHGASGGEA